MKLAELNKNDRFKIMKILLTGEIGKRIVDMGFTKGVCGQIIRKGLFGDPIQVNILNYNVSLRKSEAKFIEVEKLN